MKLKNYSIFLLIFIVVLLLFSIAYTHHLSTDSYKIINIGIRNYANVALGNGRIFQFITLIIFSKFNISFYLLYIIFLTLTGLIVTISIFILYKKFYFGLDNKIIRILLLISTINVFINVSLSEMLIFIECLNMSIAILFAIISSILFNKNKKGLSFVLLLISCLNYQASIAIFIPLAIIFNIQNKGNLIKGNEVMKICLFYFATLAICYFIIRIIPLFGIQIDNRIENVNIISNIKYILENIKFYGIIQLVVLIILFFIIKCNSKIVIVNTLIISIITIVSNVLLVFGNSSYLSLRMILPVIGLLGIIGIYLCINHNYIKNIKVLFIVQILIMSFNIFSFIYYMNINIKQTSYTKEVASEIFNIVHEYEENNKIKIKNISFYYDEKFDLYKYSLPSEWLPWHVSWSRLHFFELLLKRNITETYGDTAIYDKYFKNTNWIEFNSNQIVFESDTLHFCYF